MQPVWQIFAGLMMVAGLGTLAIAAIQDLAVRRISNILSMCLLAAGLLLHAIQHQISLSLLHGLLVFGPTFVLWSAGVLGGGDVKLLSAAACFDPKLHLSDLVLLTALAGGALGLVYLLLSVVLPPVRGRRPASRWRRMLRVEQRRIRSRGPLPYGVAIACGTLLVAA
jgi:prepilin peptidase CpaA